MKTLPDRGLAYGLVLEGGGAKGSYQIGAWKALRELKINITGVVGTSVGAINGAMMVQQDFNTAYKLWENMTYSCITNVDDAMVEKLRNFDIRPSEFKEIRRQLRKSVHGDGVDIEPLKQLIRQHIDEDKIRKSPMDFGLTTLSLSGIKKLELFKEDIPKGQLHDFILASSYLPIFKTERLHGKLYLDGGFHNKMPINMLLRKGYEDIIVIRIFGYGREKRVRTKGKNIVTIEPTEDLGGLVDFSRQLAQRNLKLGYYDTLKVFRGLIGRSYYIESRYTEEDYLQQFITISQKGRKRIAALFNTDENAYLRTVFEVILPRLARILKLEKQWTYEMLMVAILEHLAKKQGLEQFKVWSFDALRRKIQSGLVYEAGDENEKAFAGNKFTSMVSELVDLL